MKEEGNRKIREEEGEKEDMRGEERHEKSEGMNKKTRKRQQG